MKIENYSIQGLVVIYPEMHLDERGRFHRSFCMAEFSKHGISFQVKQGNLSDNFLKHTLRGFHYQKPPTEESKIFACVSGSIYNVVLDLRPTSDTFLQWNTIKVSDVDRGSIHVPAGCANAFLTLEDNTIVHYYMSEFFIPNTYSGIRYNDPFFNVDWPFEPAMISEKDATFPDYQPS